MWVLGTKPRFFGGTAGALNHWAISPAPAFKMSLHFTYSLCVCPSTWLPWCVCGGHRTTYGGWFSPSTWCVPRIELRSSAWWQISLLAEPSCWPWNFYFMKIANLVSTCACVFLNNFIDTSFPYLPCIYPPQYISVFTGWTSHCHSQFWHITITLKKGYISHG